jgi:hypothetical protein
MNINHELLNKTAVSRIIDKHRHYIEARTGKVTNVSFTPEELKKFREAFDDMFCYIYEVDEVVVEDGKLKGINL